jgi:hypothetical protein
MRLNDGNLLVDWLFSQNVAQGIYFYENRGETDRYM